MGSHLAESRTVNFLTLARQCAAISQTGGARARCVSFRSVTVSLAPQRGALFRWAENIARNLLFIKINFTMSSKWKPRFSIESAPSRVLERATSAHRHGWYINRRRPSSKCEDVPSRGRSGRASSGHKTCGEQKNNGCAMVVRTAFLDASLGND